MSNSSERLRVLLIAPSQGRYGGIEAVMLGLARSLLQTSDIEPRLCFKLVRGAVFADDLRSQCEATGAPYTVAARASAKLWLNLHWADIVHAHNPSPDVVFGSRFLRRRVLLTIINHRSASQSLHARLWDFCARLATARCYISDFVRQTWEPDGLRPGSEVMPSVPRLPDLPVVWDRSGFLFVGRWIQNKGLEELLEAYAGARIPHTQWPLTIVGDGPLRNWMEKFIQENHLATVKLAGFVSEKEKYSLMQHAKWNVAPPHTKEDLGLTPIEARHLGVPSIITRDGGLPEAAGPHALVAEPASIPSLRSRLEMAANMPGQEYRRRAELSREQLKEFLRPLSDYHDLYRRLARAR